MPLLPPFDLGDVFTEAGIAALAQVLAIDLVLAGDNAIVVGSMAAGLEARDRRRVIAVGIFAALVLRIVFALAATVLVELPGLLLAGGLLLFWVSWRFWRELRTGTHGGAGPASAGGDARRGFASAVWGVALADVSMSLDNVLGVVGAAREHPTVLVLGLIVSVALMGLAANLVAGIIERRRWIAYVGLTVIVYVAGKMSWDGWNEVAPRFGLA